MNVDLSTVDDLLLLVEVVDAGGFSAASARTGVPKSSLSRRITRLEERLGVCLIKRTSRRFEVTDVGQQLHAHGLQIRSELRAAMTVANDSGSRLGGPLRVACPIALSALIVADMAIEFTRQHPEVRLTFHTTDGLGRPPVDRYDIVIHPSAQALPDSDFVAVRLVTTAYELVAAPQLFVEGQWPSAPEQLAGQPAIGWNSAEPTPTWQLQHPSGQRVDVRLRSAFCTDNLVAVQKAALAGLGIARLPRPQCWPHIAAGRLRRVLVDWAPAPMSIFALYSSRRELTLAGRRFIQMLTSTLRQDDESPAQQAPACA